MLGLDQLEGLVHVTVAREARQVRDLDAHAGDAGQLRHLADGVGGVLAIGAEVDRDERVEVANLGECGVHLLGRDARVVLEAKGDTPAARLDLLADELPGGLLLLLGCPVVGAEALQATVVVVARKHDVVHGSAALGLDPGT